MKNGTGIITLIVQKYQEPRFLGDGVSFWTVLERPEKLNLDQTIMMKVKTVDASPYTVVNLSQVGTVDVWGKIYHMKIGINRDNLHKF